MSVAPSEHSEFALAAGDFLRVQRDVASGTALIHDTGSALLTISGPDRLTWLNSLFTQEVLGLTTRQTVESLLLDPQGRIEHSFFLTDDGMTTWLLVSKNRAESLESWLRSMVFRMDVSIERPENLVVVASMKTELLGGLSTEVVFADPWPAIDPGSVGYASDPHPGQDWQLYRAVIASEAIQGMTTAIVEPASLEALLIAAARPTMADVDERALPHELDWLRTAVHLNKGCYRGQETVAKVHNLGHPPRRITLLHLDGSESLLPESGDEVFVGDKKAGYITRAAWHYELGPIALALLKRTTPTAEDCEIRTAGGVVSARQEVIVPVDAGATRNIPRLSRLR